MQDFQFRARVGRESSCSVDNTAALRLEVDGAQNMTWLGVGTVVRVGRMRRRPDRDKGIVREWRIIEALTGTDVPHTEAIAVCTDDSVLSRTFYLMGFVDGWSPMATRDQWPAPFDRDLEARRGLGFQLVEGCALLSKVDWEAKGLEDLGRPEGFHERQVDRWTTFLERIKGRELPGFDEASAWLRDHKPLDYIPGLMHGDYQFANVMFRDGAPARLAAIVDWEMGTVGDPKLDLGWMLQSWPDEGVAAGPVFSSYADLSGMPSRSALLAHYASGEDFPWLAGQTFLRPFPPELRLRHSVSAPA